MLPTKEFTFDRVIRLLLTTAVICGLIFLVARVKSALVPFIAALLLAYLFAPLVDRVERLVRIRPLAILTSLATVAGAVCLIFRLVIPMVIREATHMGMVLKNVAVNSNLAGKAAARLPADIWTPLRDFLSSPEVQNFFTRDNLLKVAEEVLNDFNIVPGAWGVIQGAFGIVGAVVGGFVILLYLIFILMDYQLISEGWKDLIPPSCRESVIGFLTEFASVMNTYFRAQALVAFIVGVLFSIGFSLIGLPLAVPLGMFIGLLNMVPYLQLIGLIPALLLTLVNALDTDMSFLTAFALTLSVFGIVQIIQDAVLTPKIMGRAMGLNPAVMLLSLSIWGQLLGMLGLLIALPMTFLLTAYYRRYLATLQQTPVAPPSGS